MLLMTLGEDIKNKSFIDRLNMLEKLGYLDSAEHWFVYRKARNALAHEYPDNLDILVKNIEDVVRLAAGLCYYWNDLNKKIEEKITLTIF